MPYITKDLKAYVNTYIKQILNNIRNKAPDKDDEILTYVIYKLLLNHYSEGSWRRKADALKILSDVEHEYYRRVLAPYADLKIELNGDVE